MELQIHENFCFLELFLLFLGLLAPLATTPTAKDVKNSRIKFQYELEPPNPQLVQGQVLLVKVDSPDVI